MCTQKKAHTPLPPPTCNDASSTSCVPQRNTQAPAPAGTALEGAPKHLPSPSKAPSAPVLLSAPHTVSHPAAVRTPKKRPEAEENQPGKATNRGQNRCPHMLPAASDNRAQLLPHNQSVACCVQKTTHLQATPRTAGKEQAPMHYPQPVRGRTAPFHHL